MADRFYAGTEPLVAGCERQLSEEESHHLVRVMRARSGDTVRIFGGGTEAEAELSQANQRAAVLRVVQLVPSVPACSVRMTFIVPWIKGGKTEHVLEKLTELGAAQFIVYAAEREVAKGSGGKLEKLARRTIEACKQCERADVPELAEATSLNDALKIAALPKANSLVLFERERGQEFGGVVRAALAANDSRTIAIASGPEGGFASGEIESVENLAEIVGFGPRILRAETAPIAAAAAVLALAGEV